MHRLLLALAFVTTLAVTLATAQDVHVHVDPHGPGSIASTTDYTTIQQALDHAPQPPTATARIVIHIAPGVYKERINVTRLRPRVTLLGEGKGPEDVVITAAHFAKEAGGTYFTETAQINADDFEADNLTIANTAGRDNPAAGQAVAATIRSDRAIFKRVRFLGDQDTLFTDFGRQYFLDCYIEGGVDFIFGNAAAVFDHAEIHQLRSASVTAQSRTLPTQNTGFVIINSHITAPACPLNSADCRARTSFVLGRPWRAFSRVIVMNSSLPDTLDPAGWSLWKSGDPPVPQAFYAEYKNTGPGAATTARAAWSHQLTPAEAATFGPATFLRGSDDWNPIAAAAQLP